jgi:hypothetical protein
MRRNETTKGSHHRYNRRSKKGVEIAALAGMIYSEFEATLPRGSGYKSGLKPR